MPDDQPVTTSDAEQPAPASRVFWDGNAFRQVTANPGESADDLELRVWMLRSQAGNPEPPFSMFR